MFKFALITICMFILSSCSPSNSSSPTPGGTQPSTNVIQNQNPGLGQIAVIGDSIAAGFGVQDTRFTPANCLQNSFQQSVHNGAVIGYTSEQILQTVSAALNTQPRLVFVSAGGNDVLLDMNTPNSYLKTKTMEKMNRIFDQLLARGAMVVYLGLNPPIPQADRMPEISSLAASKKILVLDGMNGFWNNARYMSDAIHPNDLGYQIMCDRLLQSLQSYYP